jgi:hypothetical protein
MALIIEFRRRYSYFYCRLVCNVLLESAGPPRLLQMLRPLTSSGPTAGRGTLLHLCDDVIQQEVKEVILAYFVLMTQGKLSEAVRAAAQLFFSWLLFSGLSPSLLNFMTGISSPLLFACTQA